MMSNTPRPNGHPALHSSTNETDNHCFESYISQERILEKVWRAFYATNKD